MWKNKNVWIILAGELVAGLGLWFGIIGNLEFLQQHVPSDFFKSLILFIGLLAGVLVGPFAGKVCDRYSKKIVLLYSGFLRMISVTFMLLALHFSSISWMLVFTVTFQISAAFYFPALQATIPLIVEEKELLTINGIHMNVSTISRIAGTALGGMLLALVSLRSLYIASFVAYVILFGVTFFLNVPNDEHTNESNQRPKMRFTEMIPLLKKYPLVKIALLLTLIPMLFLGGFNLIVMSISELQHDRAIKGLLYTTEGIAFMVGAFAVKQMTRNRDLRKLLYIFSFLIAVSQGSLYLAAMKIASLASFALFGFSVGCFFPITATIFQTNIPKEYHGRFFSLKNMLDRVLFQIVLLGTGFFLDVVGLEKMVVLFSGLSLLLLIYFFVRETGNSVSLQRNDSSAG
ncbi:MFS family permease [Anoxybacillus voinovskiensis]|uniref:MFS family permease n=1 Tax=Anoxybacteroides voinovskiense TaxID=230470 RepID=A0A840DM01_9BACL|nr:MFS transporter [Anoxybacillus voinovskiensis]MBB4073920.1 MFS family permease [Anoxybacillus voinovskiensis]GGJ66131.1 MFS transporter [Anoxybacillus voinovskiensis]